jgi:hypothetical protein
MRHYHVGILLAGLLATHHTWAITELNVQDQGVVDLFLTGKSPANTLIVDFSSGLTTADFNGDKIADIAVASPSETSLRGISQTGRVAVFFGGNSLKELVSPVDPEHGKENFLISGTIQGEKIGTRLAAGDFDQDGLSDLVMYAPKKGKSDEGPRLYVVYGKTNFSAKMEMPTHADVVITHTHAKNVPNAQDSLDVLNLATGDVNGDRVDDLLILDDINNQAHVLFGKAGQKWDKAVDLSVAAGATLRVPGYDDFYHVGLVGATGSGGMTSGLLVSDLNGDGIGDIAIGLPEASVGSLEKAGQVYVVYGKTGLSGAIDLDNADIKISGGLNRDQVGGSLAAGDLDGNGQMDLIIGAPLSGLGQMSTTGIGRVLILKNVVNRGQSLDLFLDADVTLKLSGEKGKIGFYTGYTLSAQDVNHDGISDLTISSPNAFNGSGKNGWVHVVYGSNALKNMYDLDMDADLAIYTPEPPKSLCCGEMGTGLAISDVDGDGKADLLLGAPRSGFGTSSSGVLHVLLNVAAKQAGATSPSMAQLDSETFQLHLPLVTISDSPFKIWATMNLVDPTALIFELPQDSFGLVEQSSASSSTFDGNTGRLSIPNLHFSGVHYQLELVAVSSDPIRFQIDLTSLKTLP